MNARMRFCRYVAIAGIALGMLWSQPARTAEVPRFFGYVSGFRFDCNLPPAFLKAVTSMDTGGGGSLCPAGNCVGTVAYGLDTELHAPLGRGPYVVYGGRWTKIHDRGSYYVVVDPDATTMSGHMTFRLGKWMVLSGNGTMLHLNKTPPPLYLPPSPCTDDWFFAGQRRTSPPSGPRATRWILRGFIQLQAAELSANTLSHELATGETTPPPQWVAITPCATQTTCLGAPGTNRADLLVRTLPLGGGKQTPAYLALTAAGIDVWSRRVGEGDADARSWVIPAATTDLERPGFLDPLGYTPPSAATAQSESSDGVEAIPDETEDLLEAFDPERTSTVSPVAPPPPSALWLTTPSIPGFRFQAVLAGVKLLKASACPAQTFCFAKTATGVPEIVARILPKQANGKRWPVLGKFSSPIAGVWIQQIATSQIRYYALVARAADDPELLGVVDRVGFAP